MPSPHDALLAALDPGRWTVTPEGVVHKATSLEFVVVPGGEMVMGMRDDDLEEAQEHIDWTATTAHVAAQLTAAARPCRTVWVRPFLCARQLLSVDDHTRLLASAPLYDGYSADEAQDMAARFGLRLVAEAEIEWLLRDGDRFHFTLDVAQRQAAGERPFSRYGVQDLLRPQWAIEPLSVTPGQPAKAPRPMVRSALVAAFQSEEELLFALAACRWPSAEEAVGLRLAADLPPSSTH